MGFLRSTVDLWLRSWIFRYLAFPSIRRALALLLGLAGMTSGEIAEGLKSKGNVLFRNGDLVGATNMFRHALEILHQEVR